MTDLTINCEFCKKPFFIKPKRFNERKKNGQIFFCCSLQCYISHRAQIKSESVVCKECSNIFSRNKTLKRLQKFCSQRCCNKHAQRFCDPLKVSNGLKKYYSTETGKRQRRFINEKLKKYKICPQCQGKFYGTKKHCSKYCLELSLPERYNQISLTRKKMFSEGSLHVTGGTTKWLSYQDIRVQGSYEYRTCIILDKLKSLNLIKDWGKSRLRIPYLGIDQKQHSYLIDFEIFTKSGRILYLEIKGWIRHNDLLKWEAAKRQNYKLLVWKLPHLQRIENKLKI